ncbi:MAG: cation transporter, partial [Candidatus Thalassarchaeaceae archaeon]|nr:cation transporter [Candidatus Thalassarchaeaceae archaeon]
MDDSDNDILLVDDLDDPITPSSEESTISSEDVLDAEVASVSSVSPFSSVFSSMFESVGSIFNRIVSTLKSTANSASSKAKSIRQSREDQQLRKSAVAETKANQDEMVLVAAKVQSFEWEISGMDCPDCATKANQAVSRIDGVESCDVSVMEGKISIDVDLSLTAVSRISRVLDSIGFSSKRPWETIQGVTPKMVEDNRIIDRRTVRREILN